MRIRPGLEAEPVVTGCYVRSHVRKTRHLPRIWRPRSSRVLWRSPRLPATTSLISRAWGRNGVSIPAWDQITMHFLARAEQTMGPELPATTELLPAIHGNMIGKLGKLDVGVYPAFGEPANN